MARGNNVSIPSGTGRVLPTMFAERQTILVLNPNNGVLYVKVNSASDPLTWDWVVPSQSRAYLPGPWLEYGLYYVDQSGAGASGSVTVYETDQRFDVPDYAAIGVARLAQQTSMDIVEGTVPANPGAGILRLWADSTDHIHRINPAGVDAQVLDALTALSGDLTGNLPAPAVANGAISTAKLAANATFQAVNTSSGTDRTTTSLTFVDLDAALSISMTTTGGLVLVFWSGPGGTGALFTFSTDGADNSVLAAGNSGASPFIAVSTPTAAAHTWKMRWRSSGGATVNCSMGSQAIGLFSVVELKK